MEANVWSTSFQGEGVTVTSEENRLADFLYKIGRWVVCQFVEENLYPCEPVSNSESKGVWEHVLETRSGT